ncbi:MAG: hypothetical protein NTY19_06895 [Planctomycetota bacterium]|nr:hypothetical protein [Planctomycetota bacterium]
MNYHLTVVQETQNEAIELASFWPEVGDDPRLAPAEALAILATWAHLRRFPPGDVSEDVRASFDRLVWTDANRLLDHYFVVASPQGWTESALRLGEAWDGSRSRDEDEDLERLVRRLFDAIDCYGLAAYAAGQLLSTEDPRRRQLASVQRELEEAERVLSDHAEEFYPAAGLAKEMLDSYRHDWQPADHDLWLTTAKYVYLAQMYDDEQASLVAPELSPADKEAILVEVRRGHDLQNRVRRVSDLVGRFSAVRQYGMYDELAISSSCRPRGLFPSTGDDVPLVMIWTEPALRAEPPEGISSANWLAIFNGRLFWIARPESQLPAGHREPELWATVTGENPMKCPLFRVEDGGCWKFLPWLEGQAETQGLRVYATPMEHAVEFSQQSITIAIRSASTTKEVRIRSLEETIEGQVEIRELWGLLQDLSDRERSPAAVAELTNRVGQHEFRSDTPLSLTLAFYAFWLVHVNDQQDRKALLDDAGAKTLRSCWRDSPTWSPVFLDKLEQLLSQRHSQPRGSE